MERVENSVSQAMRETVAGYTRVSERSTNIHTEGGKVTPVLMPVWLITTEKEGTTYIFAINGQSGKIVGAVPVVFKKAVGLFFALAAGLSAVGGLITYLSIM